MFFYLFLPLRSPALYFEATIYMTWIRSTLRWEWSISLHALTSLIHRATSYMYVLDGY